MTNSAFSDDDYERNWFWLAVDKKGQIAQFQTRGDGAIPSTIAASLEDAEIVDAYVDSELLTASPSCEGKIRNEALGFAWRALFPSSKYESNWQQYLEGMKRCATCGLFIYDALPSGPKPRGYLQIAYPDTPLLIESLPIAIRRIVENISFSIDFSAAIVIDLPSMSSI